MSKLSRLLVVVCLIALTARAATAQTAVSDDFGAEEARFHLGPLGVTPSIALSNIGVDDNVFNEPIDPKRDSTAAFGPAGDFWLRVGPSRLKVRSQAQYLYYNKYDNQRSWNTVSDGKWDFPFARVTPFITGNYTNTRQRPGFEIDSRAHQRVWDIGAGTSVRLSGKTRVVFSGSRSTVEFDEDEQFLGADLANTLNRRTTRQELQFHDDLTPLTTFVVKASAAQDRFDFQPIRNTDSVRVTPGFEIKPAALISGKAYIGFRHFDVLSGAVENYNGMVASADVEYSIRRTLFQVHAGRDLEFSFESEQPYYAVSDSGVTVTQRVTKAWDFLGRGSWQRLAYRNLASAPTLPRRVDHGSMFGAGTGYRVGETVRLGLDVNYYRRDAPDATLNRDFHGFRIGGSITYGLQQ